MVTEEQQSDMELESEKIPVPKVQKPIEEDSSEIINKGSNSKNKPRFRKKALHASILKQMEFYFGDANLNKDRFLSSLIKEDPYVSLEVFTKFNKIRELTTDTSRIAKALRSSVMLSLSEDGTKVCRSTPIKVKENIDECTIYVQNLPPDTNHDWLSSIFSSYGVISYISIPKYKSNKKIKGFAFIEFDKPESAVQCIKAFKKRGCLLPSQISPDELLSITTFEDTEKDVTKRSHSCNFEEQENTKQFSDNFDNEMKEENQTNEDNHVSSSTDVKIPRKRKMNESENKTPVVEDEPKKKKSRKRKCNIANDSMEDSDMKNESTEDYSNDPVNNTESAADEPMKPGDDEDVIDEEKGKKRKRKRRNKIDIEEISLGLQIMPKGEWKYLRNKYLNLQRNKMKQLKQHLRKARWNQWSNNEKNKTDKEELENKEKKVDDSTCRFSFIPGVIVRIDMNEPCSDSKSFKLELKGNNNIKYIDISDGSYQAFVRCDTSEAACQLTKKQDDNKQMTILQGEEEQKYWQKILSDREEKLTKKTRVKQRGREKLLKKAEKELGKHIKFDD